jgi:HEPN domain-containing protein
MTTNEKVLYWVDLSDYDMETALTMLRGKRYLYVGFMCHQTVEKIFKAYYTKLTADTPPYTHKLSYLAEKGSFYAAFSDAQKQLIDQLDPLNIEARYPAYKELLLKSLSEAKCVELIQKTKELQQWIKTRL